MIIASRTDAHQAAARISNCARGRYSRPIYSRWTEFPPMTFITRNLPNLLAILFGLTAAVAAAMVLTR